MAVVRQVQRMLLERFPGIEPQSVDDLPKKVISGVWDRFRHMLFVADEPNKALKGFALLSHDPELNFCFLDYLSSARLDSSRGIGSALYETVREEALALRSVGIFFECLPDDPKICSDPQKLKENIARLRFYERFGARPIINTAYETPLSPEDDCPPYLVYDGLIAGRQLTNELAREIVKAILKRKYRKLCTPQYTALVVNSIVDDPISLREPRYSLGPMEAPVKAALPSANRIALVVNDKHAIHHVRARGYVESPVRIKRILEIIGKSEFFEVVNAWNFPERFIRAVHSKDFLNYVRKMIERLGDKETVYPYVFPLRNQSRPPEDLPVTVGYYCMDTFTPLNRSAYVAARSAVDCTLTATETILEGRALAYALVRPPGHHAERRAFGGFCYFNNCAIAAQYLSEFGKVAILDIDYHHGNGQQDIFYARSDVLTVSIHCHPRQAYPYFSGFEDENGEGEGKGFNLNIALPESITSDDYTKGLQRALKRIGAFKPRFLVVALGVDTSKGDPTGTWCLESADHERNGRMIGELKLPTLVVQEGGYRTVALGKNVAAFFRGLWQAHFGGDAQ